MSYILEALKKAQAERARGAIPGVDAQPLPTIAPRAPARQWLWITGALAALALGAVLLWPAAQTQQPGTPAEPTPTVAMRTGDDAGRPPASAAQTPAPTATPAAKATPAPASVVQTPAATARSAPMTPVPATATPAAPAAPAAPAVSPASPAKPARRMGETAPASSPVATPAQERVALLQELPAHIQREIPPIAINGYLYASNPADRSVLINNRLRREGDQLADGLTLEKLLPSEMVLNYRGYRYRVSY
ncbi:general secretion pathway protein GspB|uniref:general secretion pathway protein GspB n=1 Tax=Noviherbaspirillum sp. L7-7A TaxID=2850560 RepID=UPI001C2C6001|nr:general secretion pathway protein GspB [Noviherbaspirillum sp. L7-7A]MBV0877884.1 general secretion pathway protein GspB [Noviherbaspirillum sp. L7-7A]